MLIVECAVRTPPSLSRAKGVQASLDTGGKGLETGLPLSSLAVLAPEAAGEAQGTLAALLRVATLSGTRLMGLCHLYLLAYPLGFNAFETSAWGFTTFTWWFIFCGVTGLGPLYGVAPRSLGGLPLASLHMRLLTQFCSSGTSAWSGATFDWGFARCRVARAVAHVFAASAKPWCTVTAEVSEQLSVCLRHSREWCVVDAGLVVCVCCTIGGCY
jgi:hypothetical protein